MAWLALGLLVGATHASAQPAARATGVQRVIAFADVHGDYASLVELLRAAGVIDADLRWAGGAAHVVSLGDLVDRGPESRRVLDLVMRLEADARDAGGALHVVLGNHELMNLIGDWRYVTAADYASFAAEETADERAAAFAAFAADEGGSSDAAVRAEFDRMYPAGYFARRRAFSPDGRYGAWLLTLPALLSIDDTVYVHGGMSPAVAEHGLELNDIIRADLRRYLTLRAELASAGVLPALDWERDAEVASRARAAPDRAVAALAKEFVELSAAEELSPNGPVWYRGDVYCKPLLETAVLDAGLERLGAKRVVVGHTPTGDRRVRGLYGGRVVMLDTGMLGAYFKGRPAALVTEGGTAYVQYALPPERAPVEAGGTQFYGLTESALEDALAHGTVEAVDTSKGRSQWRVTLRYANETIDAAFFPLTAGGKLELAAAGVDDLLGAKLVAPTVAREVDGEAGALQLRYPDGMTESERREHRIPAGAWCPLEPQLAMMRAFDVLIGNRNRRGENVVFVGELSDVTLTDHRRSFGADFVLPRNFDPRKLGMPVPFVAALRALDRDRLQTAVGAWLDRRQLAAVIARRDGLLGR